ncbi:hypothetical protein N9S00_08100 [Luminiphilus sp.]|nr:hypothetical protein [Luminiphilus sp.]
MTTDYKELKKKYGHKPRGKRVRPSTANPQGVKFASPAGEYFVDKTDKITAAAEFHELGYTYGWIAKTLEISKSTAHSYVRLANEGFNFVPVNLEQEPEPEVQVVDINFTTIDPADYKPVSLGEQFARRPEPEPEPEPVEAISLTPSQDRWQP